MAGWTAFNDRSFKGSATAGFTLTQTYTRAVKNADGLRTYAMSGGKQNYPSSPMAGCASGERTRIPSLATGPGGVLVAWKYQPVAQVAEVKAIQLRWVRAVKYRWLRHLYLSCW